MLLPYFNTEPTFECFVNHLNQSLFWDALRDVDLVW